MMTRILIPVALALVLPGFVALSPPDAQCGCDVESTAGFVGFWRAWESRRCGDDVEGAVQSAFSYWGIGNQPGELVLRREYELTNSPDITLLGIEEDLSAKRVALISTHGGEAPGFAVEYYQSDAARSAALNYYYTHDYDGWEVTWTNVEDSVGMAYCVVITSLGIQTYLSDSLETDAIVYGDYCYSAATTAAWNPSTFIGYDFEPTAEVACSNVKTVWTRLGCGDPWYGNQVDDALRWNVSGLKAWGNEKNQLDCNRGCNEEATTFVQAGAFGDIVWWRTSSERGSRDFLVRGYQDRNGDPDILAVVPADGGYGIDQKYWTEVGGRYAFYDVVERDGNGIHSRTPLLLPGSQPDDWDAWVANPKQEYKEDEVLPPLGPLMEWVDGQMVPFDTQRSSSANMPSNNPPLPSDSLCADVVIYSSVSNFIAPVRNHVVGQGLKVRSFVGSSNPADATTTYAAVVQANADHHAACDTMPPAHRCPRLYPEDPLLTIVGDSWPATVSHKRFADEYERCNRTWCHSDFDITDTNGDGRPEGPVTRIPAETLEEVERCVEAAQDFNNGVNVDGDFHLITLAGDLEAGGYQRAVEIMDEVEDAYAPKGYLLRPMLKESDYPIYSDRKVAGAQAINAGVLELWGLGYWANTNVWPGYFVTLYNTDSLKTKQRFVGWIPGCFTASPYEYIDEAEAISSVLISNDPQKTMAAAFVGHLSGGWDFQHEEFAQILLDKRAEAAPGTPVANIVWEAVKEAQTRSWLFDYARSVGVLGGYVRIPGYLCGSGKISCDVIAPDGGETWLIGSTHTIQWRTCYNAASNERLRKHALYLSLNSGSTWETIADSVDASGTAYEWTLGSVSSAHCRIRVITDVDTLRLADSLWVPAYACTCSSDSLFTIQGTTGGPCPHLYVWNDKGFSLVNSVLKPRNGVRQPVDDYLIIRDCRLIEGNTVSFRINEVEPDTTYFYAAEISPLPNAAGVVASSDGGLFRLDTIVPPVSATEGGKGILEVIRQSDQQAFVGKSGTEATITFPPTEAKEAVVLVVGIMKNPPEQPIEPDSKSSVGLELAFDGRAQFVSGSDTLSSIVLSPRQFMSTMAVRVVNIEAPKDPLTMRLIWHSEHQVDCISIAPDPQPYVLAQAALSPARVEYVPGGTGGQDANGEWSYRLAPGDQLDLDFKPSQSDLADGTAWLLHLRGFYVTPAAGAGVRSTPVFSLRVTSQTPVSGHRLIGRFSVPHQTEVSVDVFDVRGRLVKGVLKGRTEPGIHSFEWDLRSTNGGRVAPGVYFLRLSSPERNTSQKFVIER